MDTALGLLGIAAFIVGILILAAGVTYGVVKIDAMIRNRRKAAA
jgi:hypothetical protein